jgi:hypothetical protein
MALPIKDMYQKSYYKHKDEVLRRARETGQLDVITFTEELRRLSKVHGYNFPALWTQAAHETGNPTTGEPFQSELWKSHKNPVGLKTSTGAGYQRYYNGVDAARAFVTHMSAYVPAPLQAIKLGPYRYLDTRYNIAKEANRGTTMSTYDDLAGTWAEDRNYADKIEAKFAKWFGG